MPASIRKAVSFVRLRSIAIGVFYLSLGSCSPIGIQGEESSHYLVLGFGVVSVPKGSEGEAAQVTKSQVLGIMVSDQPGIRLGIGYISGSTIAIHENARDVRIVVSDHPFGPVRIDVDSAILENDGEVHFPKERGDNLWEQAETLE